MTAYSQVEREALAEAMLIEVLRRMDLDPIFSIVGLGAAEAKVPLADGSVARLTISIDQPNEERWSVLEDAMAYRKSKQG